MAIKDTLTKLLPKRKNRPQLGRRTSTFIQVKESIGYRLRKIVYRIEDILGPIVKRLIPNFIVAHYVYLITLVLIGSILIYPARNIKYIDALFFATGACTQAGLNTLNVNQLDLYQQIVIYILCMFTTPIFIHSCVTIARLFWFEKSFDHIKETSKQNFKMRKSQTLAAFRTMTMTNTRTNSMMPNRTATFGCNRNQNGNGNGGPGGAGNGGNVHFDTHNASEDLSSRLHKYQAAYSSELGKNYKLDDVLEGVEQTTIQASSSSHTSPGSRATGNSGFADGAHHEDVELDDLDANDNVDDDDDDDDNNDDYDDNEDNNNENENGEENEDNFDAQRYNAVVHYSEPSDEGDDDDEDEQDESRPIKADQKDIRFVDLPKPPQTQAALRKRRRRRTKDINPRDLYMSISMMQHNQQQQEQQQRQQRRQQRNQLRQRLEAENSTNNATDVATDTTEGQSKSLSQSLSQSQSESGSGMLGVAGLGVGKVRLPGHHHKHRKHHKRKKREHEKLKLQKEIQDEIIEQGLSEAGVHVNGSRIQVDGVEGTFHNNTVDANGTGTGVGNETGGGNGSTTRLGLPRRKTPAVLHTTKDFQDDDEENDSAVSAEFDSDPDDHWASSTSDDETATESDDDAAVDSDRDGNNGRGYVASKRGKHPRSLSANMRGRNSDPGNGMISGTNNDGSSHVAFGHLAVPNGNNNGRRYTTDGNLHDLNPESPR
ncbi:unnamed protein product [Ambrosiozyma monospora]|uniref:Unnamed protein product n=1 Tax=Ambrosiozyma monospora TaxID=43982 RepID=A0ACB5TBN1_AMBMO|nr:unnamed protein product [Ambrosiozyma monospora]